MQRTGDGDDGLLDLNFENATSTSTARDAADVDDRTRRDLQHFHFADADAVKKWLRRGAPNQSGDDGGGGGGGGNDDDADTGTPGLTMDGFDEISTRGWTVVQQFDEGVAASIPPPPQPSLDSDAPNNPAASNLKVFLACRRVSDDGPASRPADIDDTTDDGDDDTRTTILSEDPWWTSGGGEGGGGAAAAGASGESSATTPSSVPREIRHLWKDLEQTVGAGAGDSVGGSQDDVGGGDGGGGGGEGGNSTDDNVARGPICAFLEIRGSQESLLGRDIPESLAAFVARSLNSSTSENGNNSNNGTTAPTTTTTATKAAGDGAGGDGGDAQAESKTTSSVADLESELTHVEHELSDAQQLGFHDEITTLRGRRAELLALLGRSPPSSSAAGQQQQRSVFGAAAASGNFVVYAVLVDVTRFGGTAPATTNAKPKWSLPALSPVDGDDADANVKSAARRKPGDSDTVERALDGATSSSSSVAASSGSVNVDDRAVLISVKRLWCSWTLSMEKSAAQKVWVPVTASSDGAMRRNTRNRRRNSSVISVRAKRAQEDQRYIRQQQQQQQQQQTAGATGSNDESKTPRSHFANMAPGTRFGGGGSGGGARSTSLA